MRCGRGGLLLGCGSCWPCTAGSTPAAGPGDASACRARPGPARSSRPESAAVAAGVVAARLYGRGVDDRVALAAGVGAVPAADAQAGDGADQATARREIVPVRAADRARFGPAVAHAVELAGRGRPIPDPIHRLPGIAHRFDYGAGCARSERPG